MSYFKYVSSKEACLNLVNGQLKFSRITDLNDPSEMCNLVDRTATAESLKILRANGYSDEQMKGLKRQWQLLSRLAPNMIIPPVPRSKEEANSIIRHPDYSNQDMLQQKLDELVEILNSQIGIFCVSDRFDSFPMWAHYAKYAKGYLIQFDELEAQFVGDETGVLSILKKVKYSTPRASVTFEPDSHLSVFFSKLEDWSYENEFRVIKPFSECSFDKEKNIHLFTINQKAVVRVIVGWKNQEYNDRFIKEVTGINPKVDVKKARLENGKVVV